MTQKTVNLAHKVLKLEAKKKVVAVEQPGQIPCERNGLDGTCMTVGDLYKALRAYLSKHPDGVDSVLYVESHLVKVVKHISHGQGLELYINTEVL